MMLRVFFAYPWNNLLHGLVESIATSALEEPQSALTQAFFAGHAQAALEGPSGPGLVDSFIGAWEANEAAVAGGEMRRGYMGHLIRTAATVDHMLHSMAAEQRASLLGPAEGPTAARWDRFVGETLSRELTAQQSEESAALESVLGDMGLDALAMGDMAHGGLTPSDSHLDLQQQQGQGQGQQSGSGMDHQSQRDSSGYGSLHRYVDDDDSEEEDEEQQLDDDDLDLGFDEPQQPDHHHHHQQRQRQRGQQAQQEEEEDEDSEDDDDERDDPHPFDRHERMEALMEEEAAMAAEAEVDADVQQLAHSDL